MRFRRFSSPCRQWDLGIRCGLWPGYPVIRIGERVTTDDQIDWRIVLVHDRLHEDHARMRRVQHLLQFVAGIYDVGFCHLVTREDIWQFRIPPVRDVVVLGVLTQNGSLYCVSRVVDHENEGLKVMPYDGRELLRGHLERSFSGKQDVTPPGGSENGSEQRACRIADRTPDKSPCDISADLGQREPAHPCARCSVFRNDQISGT